MKGIQRSMDFGVMRRRHREDQTQGGRDMLRDFIQSFGSLHIHVVSLSHFHVANLCELILAWPKDWADEVSKRSIWTGARCNLQTRTSDQTQNSKRRHLSSQSHDAWWITDPAPLLSFCIGKVDSDTSTHNSGLIRRGGLPQGRQGPQPPSSLLSVDGKLRFKLT